MTNKSTIIISGFLLVLLVTCNSTNTFLSNSISAQTYENEYQGSIFDFVCDEIENAKLTGTDTNLFENTDGSSGSGTSSVTMTMINKAIFQQSSLVINQAK